MRFDLGAFRRLPSANASTLAAAGGATLAVLTVLYVVWPGSDESSVEQVVVSGPVFTPVTLTPPAPSPALKPPGPGGSPSTRFDDDASVTRAVQSELKRAGCYDGPVNGVWSAPTRRAMAEFTSLVNARLPVDRADPVLLGLLETNRNTACTPGCANAAGPECPPRLAPPGQRPVQRDVRKDARPDEVASINRDRPAGTREAASPAPAPEQTTAGAEDLGFSAEDRRAPNPIASVQAASSEAEGASADETAALPTVVPAPQKNATAERRRTTRKYRKSPSFAGSVSKSFKSLQRSLNKLF